MKINSKWIKELNVRLETTKILQVNIRENSLSLVLAMTPKTHTGKAKKKKRMELHQTKEFLISRETMCKIDSNLYNEKKYLQTTCLIRG